MSRNNISRVDFVRNEEYFVWRVDEQRESSEIVQEWRDRGGRELIRDFRRP